MQNYSVVFPLAFCKHETTLLLPGNALNQTKQSQDKALHRIRISQWLLQLMLTDMNGIYTSNENNN